MIEPRKLILDKFQEHLEKGFTEYCLRHQLEASNHNFSTYIIDQNLITLPYLQRFAVTREYEYMMERDACSKSILVNTLAHRFSISERTVWEILKNIKTPRNSEKARNTG